MGISDDIVAMVKILMPSHDAARHETAMPRGQHEVCSLDAEAVNPPQRHFGAVFAVISNSS